MPTNQITGTVSGITLTSAAYNNPVTVTNTGSVGSTGDGIYGTYFDQPTEDRWTIVNQGTISASNYGISLPPGGSVTNDAGALISGGNTGVAIAAGTVTVINYGHISGGNFGIYTNYAANPVVNNMVGGTIDGGQYGVKTGHQAASATLENAGTISSEGVAVYLQANTNRLIIDPGAVFDGAVLAKPGGTGNTIELKSGAGFSHLDLQNYNNFSTIAIDSSATWGLDGTRAAFDSFGAITGFHAGDLLHIEDLGFAAGDTATYGAGELTIRDSGGASIDSIAMTGSFGGHVFDILSDGQSGSYIEEDGTPCYCRGTLILTPEGEVAVEHLRIGDMLVTASGASRPIRWIGMRAYNGWFAAGNRDILPVRIVAGALADNVPRRDLFLSPLHSMFIDNVLIPAQALVNDASITQAVSIDKVEYFHIELDTHDVIVAEGALSETFLDDDSRMMFQNAAEYRRLYPDSVRRIVEYCAPIVEDGEVLDTVRRRIAARAGEIRQAA